MGDEGLGQSAIILSRFSDAEARQFQDCYLSNGTTAAAQIQSSLPDRVLPFTTTGLTNNWQSNDQLNSEENLTCV